MDSGRYLAARAIDRGAGGSPSDLVPSASRDPCPVEHQPGHSVSARGSPWKESTSWSCDRLLSETVCAECAAPDSRRRGESGAFLFERSVQPLRSTPATRACFLGTAIAAIARDCGCASCELGPALPNASRPVLRSVQRSG